MNDLISRQAVIDALDALCDRECEYRKKQRSVMCGACHLGSAFDVVEQLPSAEPEQKKGKWIKRGGTINCSICKHCKWSECFEHTVMNFNYCPNCGADMRNEQ